MDSITIMRIIGLAATIVVFAVVVALMPRIFGVNAAVDVASGDRAPAPPAPRDAEHARPAGAATPAETPGTVGAAVKG